MTSLFHSYHTRCVCIPVQKLTMVLPSLAPHTAVLQQLHPASTHCPCIPTPFPTACTLE